MFSTSIYPPLSALLVTFLMTRFLLSSRLAHKLQDVPNNRSLHSKMVPRIGSLGMFAGIFSGWMFLADSLTWWVVCPAIGLFAVSMLDDMYSLSVGKRMLSHLIAAVVLVAGSGLLGQKGVLIALLLLLLTVWMTNIYNFMDGSDGLAGGMSLSGFGMYGAAAWLAHNPSLAMLNFCIAASAASFLYFNFQPAKIFLGDAGSIPLGFLVVAMGLWGWQQGCWAAWFPVIVFSLFIADASATLLKRAKSGASVTVAHREHYYQRLIQMGWEHRKVALVEYVLMLGAGGSALWMREYSFPWQLLLAWGMVYTGLMLLVDKQWKNFKQERNV